MNRTEKKYSQIKAMLAISRASLRSISRNPSAIIFSLAFPIVFIVAFGFLNTGNLTLQIGLDPSSDTTSTLFKSVLNEKNIELKTETDLSELTNLLNKGRLDAILRFEKITKEDTAEYVEIFSSKASSDKSQYVRLLISGLADQQNIQYYQRKNQSSESISRETRETQFKPAEIRERIIEGREYKMIDFILPGQLGFSILSAAVFGTAFVFFSLRQTLVLKRFFATPIRRPYIILGEALSRLVFQLMGSIVIITLGYFVFGFTLIHGFQTAFQMLLLSALGLIVFMGFGFVVSGIAKSEAVIPPLANLVTLPQFLLCGTFFPIDAFPQWLQYISYVLPLTYLNDALRQIAFEGAGLQDISNQILILFSWGIGIYAAAVRFFRWE